MGGRQSTKRPRGSVGEQIFAEVEQLTAGGAMPRLKAFEAVAQRTGRQVGTVAANYYRVARKRGAPLAPRRRRGAASAGGRAGGGKVSAALKALQAALQEQERELARLRAENKRFQQLRRLLA
jgi:hypothetical protein